MKPFNYILLVAPILLSAPANAQERELCKAADKGDFKKVEKIIEREAAKYKKGRSVNNGSATYTTFDLALDSLISWLGKFGCVEQVIWDKCQDKPDKIPYNFSIGVIFKANNVSIEKVFTLQVRTSRHTGDRLYYLGMKEQTGFVREQYLLCSKSDKSALNASATGSSQDKHQPTTLNYYTDSINYNSLLGNYICIDKNIIDTIRFKKVEEYGIKMTRSPKAGNNVLNEAYSFKIIAPNIIDHIGTYSPWRIQVAKIKVTGTDILEIAYSNAYTFPDNSTVTLKYKKLQEQDVH
ncbi:MAG: hypothetical protein JNM21_08155 [Taibaiella sp.]|nr:hypothetical protein [Taibaiella sp.]